MRKYGITKGLEFKHDQRGVVFAAVAALVTTILVAGAVAIVDRNATAKPFVDLLQSTIQVDFLVIFWFVVAIKNIARLRFFSERDIAGSSAEPASEDARELAQYCKTPSSEPFWQS